MVVNPTGAVSQVAAKVGCKTCDPKAHAATKETQAQNNSFQHTIRSLLNSANQPHQEASLAVNELVAGKTENIHSVVMSVAKAEMSFRFLLEMRNRLTEAYQEIMRMQM